MTKFKEGNKIHTIKEFTPEYGGWVKFAHIRGTFAGIVVEIKKNFLIVDMLKVYSFTHKAGKYKENRYLGISFNKIKL